MEENTNGHDGMWVGHIITEEQQPYLDALVARLEKIHYGTLYQPNHQTVLVTRADGMGAEPTVLFPEQAAGQDTISWIITHTEFLLEHFYDGVNPDEVDQESYKYDCPDDGIFPIGRVSYLYMELAEMDRCPRCLRDWGNKVRS